jgi:hypothetical protein
LNSTVFLKLEVDYALWFGKDDDADRPTAAKTVNITGRGLTSHEPGYP